MIRDDEVPLAERIAIHEKMAAARPRLARLAMARGVAPDAIDDVVQEALLEAWQYRGRLRGPEQLDVWLDGICRNVCRRWQARQARSRSIPLTSVVGEEDLGAEQPVFDSHSAALFDPAEALARQDLEALLDRALGHLSPENRRAIELYYLLEMPQRETALRLGMTISALQARLHRARHQLQHVFSGALRIDAEAFGLVPTLDPGEEIAVNWRESREWCDMCGRQRLYGSFQSLSDGTVMLRMRCPACSVRSNNAALLGFLPPGEWSSFRPALKRIEQGYLDGILRRYQAGRPGICARCGAENTIHLMSHEAYLARFSPGSSIASEEAVLPLLVFQCHACAAISTSCGWNAALFHPLMRLFKQRHPRSIIEWMVLVEYAGSPAFLLRVGDIASTASISAFLHAETVRVLAVIEE